MPVTEWRDIVTNGVTEGARNTTATRLAGYLLRRSIDPLIALELLQLHTALHHYHPQTLRRLSRPSPRKN